MTWSNAEIDEIVRRVCARVLANHGDTVTRTESTAERGTLRLSDRVITLATLEGHLTGVCRVAVPAKAVLTPAVLDELRQRSISLCRIGSTSKPDWEITTVLLTCQSEQSWQWIADAMRKNGDAVEIRSELSVPDMVKFLDQESHRQKSVVITTRSVEVACLANRREQTRAAVGWNLRSTKDAVEQIDANTLVVHPGRVSRHEILQMIRYFVSKTI